MAELNLIEMSENVTHEMVETEANLRVANRRYLFSRKSKVKGSRRKQTSRYIKSI